MALRCLNSSSVSNILYFLGLAIGNRRRFFYFIIKRQYMLNMFSQISLCQYTRQLINQLIAVGIKVRQEPIMHEHYAIIDEEIVWYGSMNLLSGEKEDDNLMRVVSKEIVLELMEITFGKNMQEVKEHESKDK